MLQRTVQLVADDLHVPVQVGAESLSRLAPVLIEDPQRPKAPVLRVVILAERERVIALHHLSWVWPRSSAFRIRIIVNFPHDNLINRLRIRKDYPSCIWRLP